MVRVYRRSPDAKKEKITVPLSEAVWEKLKVYAADLGVLPTEAARQCILEVLQRVEQAR